MRHQQGYKESEGFSIEISCYGRCRVLILTADCENVATEILQQASNKFGGKAEPETAVYIETASEKFVLRTALETSRGN